MLTLIMRQQPKLTVRAPTLVLVPSRTVSNAKHGMYQYSADTDIFSWVNNGRKRFVQRQAMGVSYISSTMKKP